MRVNLSSKAPNLRQRGGTVVGIIIGLLLGLCAALAVAIYVTKVPVPFVNKPPVRSAQQDQDEARKNQGWNPNAPLQQNKPAAGTASAPAFPVQPPPDPGKPDPVAKPPATNSTNSTDATAAKPAKPAKSASAADPLGELANAKTAKATDKGSDKPADKAAEKVTAAPPLAANPGAASADGTVDPFTYFVQAGAFRTAEDAEAQRAKLGLMGVNAKVTEREQAGRTVWRVRIGPFQKKDDADKTKERLDGSGFETALVRVQR
jgi:cell division protein FtsN